MGGGKKKRQSSRVRDLSDGDLDAALAEIQAGSDRVAAIIGCAIVENTLVGAILATLRSEADAAKLFDDVRGPFNTFYSQIVAGEAIGLFEASIADALHTVRQIRNRFAHDVLSLKFDDAEISAKCAKLEAFLLKTDPKIPPEDSSRDRYVDACVKLSTLVMRGGNAAMSRKVQELKLMHSALEMRLAAGEPANLSDFLHLISPRFEGRG